MVPFVLCNTYKCPRASECFRLRASPDTDQRYENFSNLCNEDNNHNFFMKIRPEDNVINLEEINSMKNIIAQSKGEEFNPNTSDDLRFINHVEDEIIKLDEILEENAKNKSLEIGVCKA